MTGFRFKSTWKSTKNRTNKCVSYKCNELLHSNENEWTAAICNMKNFTKGILRDINQTHKEAYILHYSISVYFKTKGNYSMVLKVRTGSLEEGGREQRWKEMKKAFEVLLVSISWPQQRLYGCVYFAITHWSGYLRSIHFICIIYINFKLKHKRDVGNLFY